MDGSTERSAIVGENGLNLSSTESKLASPLGYAMCQIDFHDAKTLDFY